MASKKTYVEGIGPSYVNYQVLWAYEFLAGIFWQANFNDFLYSDCSVLGTFKAAKLYKVVILAPKLIYRSYIM